MKPSFRTSYFVASFFQLMVSINGWSYKLDVSQNGNNSAWTISGDYSYYDSADQLMGKPSAYLPEKFNFVKMIHDNGIGIWMVHPKDAYLCQEAGPLWDGNWDDFDWDLEGDNSVHQNGSDPETSTTTTTVAPTTKPSCDLSASASFLFALRHPVLESVTIKYNFGGNATLLVTGNSRHSVLIPANYSRIVGWGHVKLPVEGSKMLLEAIVNTTGDFILIDSITVETLETSTTSTTHRPKHQPTSSGTSTSAEDNIPSVTSTTTTGATKRRSHQTQPPTTTAPTTELPLTTENPEPAPVSGQNRVSSGVLLGYLWILAIFAKFAV